MTLPRLDIRAALSKPPKSFDFVLPGLPRGTTGALVATGGTGKTTFALQAALSLAVGLTIAGGAFPAASEPCKAVLLAAEEDQLALIHRLHSIRNWLCEAPLQLPDGASLPSEELVARMESNLFVFPMSGNDVQILQERKRTSAFGKLLKQCADARLVLLDPARRLHDGNENDSGDMTALVEAGERLAREVDSAVVFLHHTNKAAMFNGFSDQQNAGRGSSALTDGVRWQCNLAGMTREEARAHGVETDQRFFVRLEISKANYIAPFPSTWLRRCAGGVLTKVSSLASVPTLAPKKPSRQREIRYVS